MLHSNVFDSMQWPGLGERRHGPSVRLQSGRWGHSRRDEQNWVGKSGDADIHSGRIEEEGLLLLSMALTFLC